MHTAKERSCGTRSQPLGGTGHIGVLLPVPGYDTRQRHSSYWITRPKRQSAVQVPLGRLGNSYYQATLLARGCKYPANRRLRLASTQHPRPRTTPRGQAELNASRHLAPENFNNTNTEQIDGSDVSRCTTRTGRAHGSRPDQNNERPMSAFGPGKAWQC